MRLVGSGLAAVLLLTGLSALAGETPPGLPPTAFTGSFELSGGEVITGGPFVERAGQPVRFLYMDTEGLKKVGLFERTGDSMRSVDPEDAVTLEWIRDEDGAVRELVWNGPDGSVRGRRIAPHTERSLTVESEDGTVLRARLLTPACPGPHPLVVLVGGSGPTTRWAGTFDTFFVRLGMAALVYDKRGVGEEGWTEPDLADLAADAAAVVRAARELPGVDRRRVGFWASSQGGWVAPMAAAEVDPAFLLVRVGPGVSEMETVLHEKRQDLRREEGLTGMALDHAMALRREVYELARDGAALEDGEALVAPYRDEPWFHTAFGESLGKAFPEYWWRWAAGNLNVTPEPYLERLDTPILWFLAAEDENVPLVPSRVALERAFAASPGEDQTLVVLPDIGHSFLPPDAESETGYVPGFFDRMADWLAERGLSDPECGSRSGRAQGRGRSPGPGCSSWVPSSWDGW